MTAIPEAYEPATFSKAWDLTIKHIGTFLVVSLGVLGFGFIAWVVFVLILALSAGLFSAMSDGGSSSGFSIIILGGYALGGLGALPFFVMSMLFWILLSAIPAIYFENGGVMGAGASLRLLTKRPLRFLGAGALYSLAYCVGLCAIVPALAVWFVGPVFMNRIFNRDLGVFETFCGSFGAVFKSEQCWPFVGIQCVVWLVSNIPNLCCVFPAQIANAILPVLSLPVLVVANMIILCLAVPASSFYVQNVAYRRGILT